MQVKVCFKNILEDKEKFEEIEATGLISAVQNYAKTKDLSIYTTIMQKKVNIYVNKELVKVDDWIGFEVSEGDNIIITPTLEGKNGGIISTIVGIVLIAVAWWNPAGWTAGAKFLLGLGVSLALGGVSQLLFSPDLPTLPSYSSKGGKETQTYNWSGIKTTAQLDSPIPVVYGTHAIGGNIISLYTLSKGTNENYLYMLLGLSEGEIEGICQETDYTQVCQTSDTTDPAYKTPAILIDNQPLRNYDVVNWWYRTGSNLPDNTESQYYPFVQNIISKFPSSNIQYDDGRELDSTLWTTWTTTKEVDILTLNFETPALYQLNQTTGEIEPYSYKYNLEWRKVGEVTWNPLTLAKYSPQVTVEAGSTGNIEYCSVAYAYRLFSWGVKPSSYRIVVTGSQFIVSLVEPATFGRTFRTVQKLDVDIFDEDGNFIESKQILGEKIQVNMLTPEPELNVSEEEVEVSVIDPSFIIDAYKVTFEFNSIEVGSEFTISSYKVEDATDLSFEAKSKSSVRDVRSIDFTDVSDGKGFYEVRVKRSDGGPSSSMYIEDRVVLESVIETIQGRFIYPNTALLGLEIKATGQLSGSPPNIVTVVKGVKVEVPDIQDASPSGADVAFEDTYWDQDQGRWEDYDGNEVFWNDNTSWRKEYTENFMCCARDILLNKRYGVGRYITGSNINKVDVITGIRECHKEYYANDDLVAWWDSGQNSSWETRWSVGACSPSLNEYGLVFDSSARYIDIPGGIDVLEVNNPYIGFQFDLARPLKRGQTYTLSLDLSNIGKSITSIQIYGVTGEGGIFPNEYLGTISGINTTSTQTLTFTTTKTSYALNIAFLRELGGSIFRKTRLNFRIDDLSVVKGVAPATDPIDVSGEGGKEHFHTFNGVLESDKSALTALTEMCEAFRCWPTWYGGTFSFIMDTDNTPVHTLTMGNTKNFKQSFTPISEIPYNIIGQYVDESINFNMRSVIVKSSASNINRINESTVGLKGLTDFGRVARELKWKMDLIENCNRTIELDTDIDAVHFTAGDIFFLQDDLPQWGQGGRILDYTSTHVTLDKKYIFSNVATDTFVVRFQDDQNNFNVATVDTTSISNNASLQVIPIDTLVASPCTDSVYLIGDVTNDLKKFRAFYVGRTEENSIKVIAREHKSNLYTDSNFSVVEINRTRVPDVLDIPPPLKNVSVTPLLPVEGKGFNIGFLLADGDTLTKEVVVQLDRTGTSNFETIQIISVDQGRSKFVDSSLLFDTNYTIRVYGRSQFKQSNPVDIITSIKKSLFSNAIYPPSGISVKDSNSNQFTGKDVTITWNASGSSTSSDLSITGYKIEVVYGLPQALSDSIVGPAVGNNTNITQILRTEFVSGTSYTYTLEMNEADCARLNLSNSSYATLYFKVFTIAGGTITSSYHVLYKVVNPFPPSVSRLVNESTVGGVRFSWTKSTELDHRNYIYRTMVGGSWGGWKTTENSIVARSLTATEINSYGSKASIHFEVKDVDWYNQQSITASVTASANKVSDNIYQLFPSVSASITGNTASLLDNIKDSGGVTIP